MTPSTATISALDLADLTAGAGAVGTPSEMRVAQRLRTACVAHGFFYLVNHGVSADLIAATFRGSRSFFEMSAQQKRTVLAVKSRGYTPLAEETLDPERQSCGDTKEGFYIGNKEAGEVDANAAIGANLWPDEAALPRLDGWKDTMCAYFQAVHLLGMRLLRVLALSLDLPADYFTPKFSDPMEALRLLHYSAQKSDAGAGILGCGAHSDYGMLTLLITDNVPGLEILRSGCSVQTARDEDWLPVAPRADCFIVNLGDMLARWTNDLYSSTVHRVVNRSGRERYSIPFFFEPNFDCVVSCLEGFGPAKYAPTTSGAYLLSKYSQTHAMFKKEGGEEQEEEAESGESGRVASGI